MKEQDNFQPAKLEVDEDIIDKSLQFVSSAEDDEISSLFSSMSTAKPKIETLVPELEYPSVLATPLAGICVKTRNAAGQKFFINLCKLIELPRPPPITEEELEKMIVEEDYGSLWRVPMSIGAPRKEKDKSGGECWAAEVAVNRSWFEDVMQKSESFTAFVVTIAMEGLAEKYGEEARLDRQNWVILQNKKFLGDKPPQHRIQQRASSGIQEIGETSNYVPPMEEKKKDMTKPFGETAQLITSGKAGKSLKETKPKFKIIKKPLENPEKLIATIQLPGVQNEKDVDLNIGEDRLILEARKFGYLLDIFLPYMFNQDESDAFFDIFKQELTVNMKISSTGESKPS